jgi:hypothetical protein
MTDMTRPEPKKRLYDFDFSMEGAEVSLVDSAANGHKFLMLKAENPTQEVIEQAEVVENEPQEVTKNIQNLMNILGQMLGGSPQAIAPATQQNGFDVEIGRFLSYLTDHIRQSTPDEPLPHRVSDVSYNQQTQAPLFITEKSEDNEMPLEDIIKSEEGQKLLNELVEKAVDSVKKENEELKKSLEYFQKQQEILRDQQFVDVAKSLNALGFTEEHGQVLKAICDKAPEEYSVLVELLNKASNINKNEEMFQEIGTEAEGSSDELVDGIPKHIAMKALELQKADSTLTRPQAIAKALKSK